MILSMIKHNYSFIILVRSIAFCVGIRTPYHNTIAIKGVLKIRRQKSFKDKNNSFSFQHFLTV